VTARSSTGYARFIRAHTSQTSPPLVPEITLHLASEVTPLWQATEADLERSGLPPPYWAFAWPGGQALARFLLDHPAWVAGRRVLDFASGSGLAAIAAARAGAVEVSASDVDPYAAAAIALNAALNRVCLEVDPQDRIGAALDGIDVVLAGDVCYERPMAERTMTWLGALARGGITVLLGDPGRAYFRSAGLVRLAAYGVETSRELEDKEVRDTAVWRVAP
jgi:predicted nicotinamide N-methyase